MSEYWKSVPRKFCDFCKCWITDNKPSVDFHERGKRHQENVQQRLKEVRKRSYEKSLEQDAMDKQMEKMEKAAMEAFKKDLAANPELAKHYGVSLESKPKPKPDSKSASSDKADENEAETKEETKAPSTKEWWEAKSPEGYSYYWSTVTGEPRWEAPEEFVSLEEQEAENAKAEETVSDQKTETVEEPEENPVYLRQTVDPPSASNSVYGAWNVVREESRPPVYDESSVAPAPDDIPLPNELPSLEEIPLPQPQRPKFREKTVSSLGTTSDGVATFKKRKIASGARNVRKRGDDD